MKHESMQNHSAYPPFHRSEIAAAEMSLEMPIEAVEAVREQNAKLATVATSSLRASVLVTPSPPANQNGEVRHSSGWYPPPSR
jgi:hypothetical protein